MKKKKKNNYYLYCPEAESESGIVIPKTENEQMTSQISETSEKIILSSYQEMGKESSQTSEKSIPNTPNQKEGLENTQNISPYQHGIEEETPTNTQPNEATKEKSIQLESEEETKEKSQISKWDEQFMELRNNKLSSEETPMQLQDNFVAAATTYSKMIIAERHIKTKDKKMQPMDVGGVAGT
jgi:hypothetical protein